MLVNFFFIAGSTVELEEPNIFRGGTWRKYHGSTSNNVNKRFLQSPPTHTHGSTLIEHCVGCFKLRAADPV